MADLLQFQNQNFNKLFSRLLLLVRRASLPSPPDFSSASSPPQNPEELLAMRHDVTQGCAMQQLDSIAAIAIGATEASPEEELLTALVHRKYDALRRRVFERVCEAARGETAWAALSSEEQERDIAELAVQEAQLRADGRTEELGRLAGPEGAKMAAVGMLLGPDLGAVAQRRLIIDDRRQTMEAEGKKLKKEDYLRGANEDVVHNTLADLGARQEAELNFLVQVLVVSVFVMKSTSLPKP